MSPALASVPASVVAGCYHAERDARCACGRWRRADRDRCCSFCAGDPNGDHGTPCEIRQFSHQGRRH